MVSKQRNSKSGSSKKRLAGLKHARVDTSVRSRNRSKNPQSNLPTRNFSKLRKLTREQRLERGERVLATMLHDPSLSFTATARKHKVDPRWVLKHLGWKFRKDSSGRIRAKVRNSRYKTLYKPTSTPGVSVPVVTKNKGERQQLGQWMAALNAARSNHWSRMARFPKGQYIGGVLLETDPKEVQEILLALAEQESPFEGLYRTIVRRR